MHWGLCISQHLAIRFPLVSLSFHSSVLIPPVPHLVCPVEQHLVPVPSGGDFRYFSIHPGPGGMYSPVVSLGDEADRILPAFGAVDDSDQVQPLLDLFIFWLAHHIAGTSTYREEVQVDVPLIVSGALLDVMLGLTGHHDRISPASQHHPYVYHGRWFAYGQQRGREVSVYVCISCSCRGTGTFGTSSRKFRRHPKKEVTTLRVP